MSSETIFMPADWPAPAPIRAGTSLRHGGVSASPYASLNLGAHTGDAPAAVATNRQRLRQALALPAEPAWLTQVHGTHVATAATAAKAPADACVADAATAVCAVMTADCLPVLLCNRAGTCWGAAHAGWRGLVGGVLEATIQRLDAAPAQLLAWLGPAIGPQAFEVGTDVYTAFCRQHVEDADAFTSTGTAGKYWADIYRLARARLRRAGVTAVYGGGLCTYSAPQRFYSYRREGETGRMASLIWCTA